MIASSIRNAFLHLVTATVVGSLGWAANAFADDSKPDTAEPLAYRRILVPAERPETWPRDGKTFLPVEARDFEDWVAAANRPDADAHIVEAEYRARLSGDQLVDGHARWSVALGGADPAFIPLGQPSIAIEKPRWLTNEKPALLGWWPRAAGYGLQVPEPGDLVFAWHTLPVRAAGNELQIPLQLPGATRRRLTVDLPTEKQLAIEGGILLSNELAPDSVHGGRRWVFALNESAVHQLRITEPELEPSKRSPVATVHEDRRYQIAQRGLDLEARFRIDPAGRLPRELNVAVPADLHLIAATIDGRALSWRIVENTDGTARRAIIELAALPPNAQTTIVLRAWSRLVAGGPWQLPRLRLTDATWTSGSIKVALDDSLELRELTPIDCIQTGVEFREVAGRKTELLSFDAYSPDAGIEIHVADRPTSCQLRVGTTLQVGNPGIAGRMITEVDVERGELHTLSGTLQPGWTIDAVEAIPADALGQWYVDSHDGHRTVELQFNRAIIRGENIAVVVTGRLQRSAPFEPLARESLTMLGWHELELTRNLLRLDATEPYELEPIGKLASLPSNELSDRDRELVHGISVAPIYDLTTTAPDVSVRLAPKRGSYHAEIQLDATLIGRRLHNSYRIVCRPQQSGIDHVLVHLSEPPAHALRWVDADSREAVAARKMPASDPRLGGLPPGGELWLLDLRGLYVRPVTLVATTELPWTDRRRIPLVSLPEAPVQQGRITLRCADKTAPTIVAQGMTPAPLPVDPRDASRETDARPRVAYRYQPTRFYAAAAPPQLWLGHGAKPVADQLLATEVSVESYLAADGTGAHRVTYQLENRGAASVTITPPSGMRLESASLDGKPLNALLSQSEPNASEIHFPTARRELELGLSLRSEAAPLANGGRVTSPLPTADLTMLNGRWTIWLPNEFLAVGDAVATSDERFDWRDRLFGPLARPREQFRFNPFRSDHWYTLMPGDTTQQAVAAAAVEAASANDEQIAREGWHASHVAFVSLPPQGLTILRPTTTGAWSLSIFLLVVVGISIRGIRPMPWILGASSAAMLCLLLPPAFASLATGALVGLLLAPLCRWAWQRTSENQSRSAESDVTRGTAAIPYIAIGALLLATGSALAEPPQAIAPNSIEKVFLPVDDHRQPVGTKVFLSDDFFAQLLRLSTNQSAGGNWMLRGLRCEAEPASRPSGADSGPIGNWTLAFDLEVLTRDAKVELPLVQQEAIWPTAASLDGIPATLVWNDDGNGCAIDVQEPGTYQLSISLEPKSRATAGRREVALTVPPVTGGRFRLTSPAPTTGASVNGNAIARRNEPGRAVWECELDGSGELTASWHTAAENRAASNRSIDELQWLSIARDGIDLRVKYVLPTDSIGPKAITVLADSRWEYVAPAGGPADNVATTSEGRRSIEVPITVLEGGRREAELRFRLRDTEVLGQLQTPKVELASTSAVRRWLGVSADSSLECEPSSGTAVSAGADGDFAAAWANDATAAPRLVIDLASVDPDWYLAVRPRSAESAYTERLNVAVGREVFRLQYLADVEPQLADCFGWTLAVPEEMSLESVSAEEAGGTIPLHWARVAPTRLNVYFDRKATGPYRLRISGTLPHAGSGEVAVPRLAAADLARSSQTVAVYREANVRIALPQPGDKRIDDSPAEAPPSNWTARFVGILPTDRSTTPPTLQIEPTDSSEATPVTTNANASSASIADATSAPLRIPTADGKSASVRLADTTTFLGTTGGEFSISRFIIDPQGIDQCAVRLPEGQRLVRLSLDGHPALAQHVDPRRWRVQLSSPNLPQTLEIVARRVGRNADIDRTTVLKRPALEQAGQPIPVELSLWSLCSPTTSAQLRAIGAATLTSADRATVRLDRMTSISEAATPTVIESPTADGYHWYVRWVARLQSARELARAEQAPAASEIATGRVQAAENPAEAAIARCDAWIAQFEDLFVDAELAAADTASDRLSTPPGCAWAHFVTNSPQATLDVEFVPSSVTPTQSRAIALVSIVALALAAGWLARQPAAFDALREWPQLAGVVLGLAVWMWLWPSWLGLLVATVSVALLLRQAYVRRAHLATITTFVRKK